MIHIIVVIILAICFVWQLFRLTRPKKKDEKAFEVLIAGFSLILFFSSLPFQINSSPCFFFFLIGILFSIYLGYLSFEDKSIPKSKRLGLLLSAMMFLIFSAAFFIPIMFQNLGISQNQCSKFIPIEAASYPGDQGRLR